MPPFADALCWVCHCRCQLFKGSFRQQCFGDDGTAWAGLNYDVNATGGNATLYCPSVGQQSTCPAGYMCLAQG